MKAELFCVHKHDTVRLHHLHTVSIIHQNRDALLESVFNRTPWTARSVGSGMAHTEASQTAPHPWILLASPVAAQTPVMQDPSTSTSCAGLTHPQAPNFVTTTATVGGSALCEKVYTHTHTHRDIHTHTHTNTNTHARERARVRFSQFTYF